MEPNKRLGLSVCLLWNA